MPTLPVKDKVQFNHIKSQNYSIFAATDAFGQINTRGNLIINFHSDIGTIPSNTLQKINEDSTINETDIKWNFQQDSNDDTVYMDRIIHSTAIMSPDSSLTLSLWILEMIAGNPSVKFDREKIKQRIDEIFKAGEQR